MSFLDAIFGSSQKTTSEAKSAPLSGRGEEYQSIYDTLYAGLLEEFGYDVDLNEKEVYKDNQKFGEYTSKLASAKDNRDKIQSQIDTALQRSGGQVTRDIMNMRSQLELAQNQVDNYQGRLDSLDKETISDFTLEKREDPRIENAIRQYGENSTQVQNIRTQINQEEVFQAETLASVSKNYLTNLNKFVNGDLTYTDEQYNQVAKYTDPIKDIITKTTDDLLSKFGDNYEDLYAGLNEVGKQMDQTGIDIEDALRAAEVQASVSGDRLVDILKDVNSSSEARMRFQFGLLSQEAEERAAQQAALLGLPPGSESEKYQAQKLKTDALTSLELELANQEANGILNIRSAEESQKQKISLSRVSLASDLGSQRIDLAKTKTNLFSDYLSKEENVLKEQANSLLGLEQTKQNQLLNNAYGNIPNLLSAGQSGLNFNINQTGQNLNQASSIMAGASNVNSIEENRRLFEGKKTNTTESTPSLFSSFTDVIGAGLSMYGAGAGLFPVSSGSSGSSIGSNYGFKF